MPLGGLGRIGGNLMALETAEDLLVIDCGVLFPWELHPGVDCLIPDITYLLERREKVRGIVLTHGHEDHIGGLPYVLPQLDVPVFASSFTRKLVEAKLSEFPDVQCTMHTFADGEPFWVGKLRILPIPVTHSIPEAVALAIETPAGRVVHSGDFKIDTSPLDGRHFDSDMLRRLGDAGVALLLSDSTNAAKPGHTWSEAALQAPLQDLIEAAPQRVFVTTFASNIYRLQTVVQASEHANRFVLPLGRSIQQNLQIARDSGYLRIGPETLTTPGDAAALPRHRLTVLLSGSQGERNSALVRMAAGRHPQLSIEPDDLVLFSSRKIPGNERRIGALMNDLARLGADIVDDRSARIHSSGHAFNEEQATFLRLCRPRVFIPVHGEYRHLQSHALLAESIESPPENTFVVENGQPVEMVAESGELHASLGAAVPAGLSYVEGSGIGEVDDVMLRERRILSSAGVVTCSICLSRSGELLARPKLNTLGVAHLEADPALLEQARDAVTAAIARLDTPVAAEQANEAVRLAIRRFFRKALGAKPMIMPMTTVTELP